MTVGERLRQLRGDVPRKIVAEIIGVSETALSNYENDIIVPRDGIKQSFANYYGETVAELFCKDIDD